MIFSRWLVGRCFAFPTYADTIQDEVEYAAHLDYVHINPLKHGWVEHVADWPHSTFHHAVAQGIYPADWAVAPTDLAAGERVDSAR
ncbi:MAG: hypothetical protein P4L87_18515 [Formivibrio sp.]|nr:hypothetical protein [Formivibrio sp.]